MEKVQEQVEQIGNTTVLKEINICDGTTCEKRTVWIPAHIKQYNVPSIPHAKLASQEINREAANIQKTLQLTLGPALIYERYSIYNRDYSPAEANVLIDQNGNPNALYITMDPQLMGTPQKNKMFNFVLGHEFSHFTNDGGVHNVNKLTNSYTWYKNIAQYGFLFGILSECIGLVGTMIFPRQSKMPLYKYLFSACIALGFGSCATGYYQGNICAKELQSIEYTCDQIAVNAGKNPEEKIALAQSGQKFFGMCEHTNNESLSTESSDSKIPKARYTWQYCMNRCIPFPSTHPSPEKRINALQILIDEQKTILSGKQNEN
jgi:hypothetical protein